MDERIETLHPEGKKGVNILTNKYKQVKDTIIKILEESGEIEFKQLNRRAVDTLTGKFEGKITWYVITVKLDLEARGIIERVPKSSPQRVRLKIS